MCVQSGRERERGLIPFPLFVCSTCFVVLSVLVQCLPIWTDCEVSLSIDAYADEDVRKETWEPIVREWATHNGCRLGKTSESRMMLKITIMCNDGEKMELQVTCMHMLHKHTCATCAQ